MLLPHEVSCFSPEATVKLLLVKSLVCVDVHSSDHRVVYSNKSLSISQDNSIIVLVGELGVNMLLVTTLAIRNNYSKDSVIMEVDHG